MEEMSRIGARIDAMPGSSQLWKFVALIAAGGFFEIYDLALTAPISSGLAAAGIFRTGHAGFFGLADQATFILATFGGLYLGVIGFSISGDRLGRKMVFAYALIWYAAATAIMGLQNSPGMVCVWRFIAGVGLGAEAVAIDCFVVEVVPARIRGRAFSLSMFVQYCAIPTSALLAALLVPAPVLNIPGWRLMTFVPVLGAIGFWCLRRKLPESQRWLATQRRFAEADAILDWLGAPHAAQAKPQIQIESCSLERGKSYIGKYVRRTTITLLIYTNLQVFAYYGFANWLPTFLEAQGVPLKESLFYNFGVALAAPLAALMLGYSSDLFERRNQIIGYGLASVVLALLFGHASMPFAWVSFGLGLSFANSVLSVLTHNYFSEVFPTELRARAVGFVYSFTRIMAALSGYLVAWLLDFGVAVVFVTISVAMFAAVLSLIVAGPRTLGRSFEEITGRA
ncbi:MFS transporter [Bradyrhizobium pachyrhizi]|uniref:MFS transporter n=1 Tax=Bradyrhizobium pachyrhizi TaxID=280333 RepID=UPI003D3660EE